MVFWYNIIAKTGELSCFGYLAYCNARNRYLREKQVELGKRQGTDKQTKNSIDDICAYHSGVRGSVVNSRISSFIHTDDLERSRAEYLKNLSDE